MTEGSPENPMMNPVEQGVESVDSGRREKLEEFGKVVESVMDYAPDGEKELSESEAADIVDAAESLLATTSAMTEGTSPDANDQVLEKQVTALVEKLRSAGRNQKAEEVNEAFNGVRGDNVS